MQKRLTSYSDSELLALFKGEKRNSEAAFSEMYRRYSGKVHAYCVKMLGDEDAAEDVFQETFIKFYHKVDPGRNDFNVPGFLMTIARNLCFNYFRDKKQTVDIENMDFSSGQGDAYERKELLELITMALDVLPLDYKEAFILREYDGLSY